MNRIIRLIATISSVAFLITQNVAAQECDTVKISTYATTHIRFASDIKYVDISSKVIAAKIVDGGRDILALKARESFDHTTSVSCLEASGTMHTFIVMYAEHPSELIIDTRKSKTAIPTTTAVHHTPDSTRTMDIQEMMKRPKRFHHLGGLSDGIECFCDNIFIHDDVCYLVLSFHNKSNLSYDFSDPRFTIESKRHSRKKLPYEKHLYPKQAIGLNKVSPSQTQTLLFSLDKFTLMPNQTFNLYFYEKGGSRNFRIVFENYDFKKAESF